MDEITFHRDIKDQAYSLVHIWQKNLCQMLRKGKFRHFDDFISRVVWINLMDKNHQMEYDYGLEMVRSTLREKQIRLSHYDRLLDRMVFGC